MKYIKITHVETKDEKENTIHRMVWKMKDKENQKKL